MNSHRSSIGYIIATILLIIIMLFAVLVEYLDSKRNYESIDRDIMLIGGIFKILYCLDIPLNKVRFKNFDVSIREEATRIMFTVSVGNGLTYRITIYRDAVECPTDWNGTTF